jgi:hypothetical protein
MPGESLTGRVRQDDIVIDAAAQDIEQALQLPSTGPDPMPFDTALAAVLGYALGPLRFRSPDSPHGRWVQLPAFGWARFDAQPVGPSGDTHVLISEGLHGRLDRAGWADVRDALARVHPLADAAADRAGGRASGSCPTRSCQCSANRAPSALPCAKSGGPAGTTPSRQFAQRKTVR